MVNKFIFHRRTDADIVKNNEGISDADITVEEFLNKECEQIIAVRNYAFDMRFNMHRTFVLMELILLINFDEIIAMVLLPFVQ